MTEAEWLNAEHPWPMLELVETKVSERKLRFFASACCRSIWAMIDDETCRAAVDVVEKFADGIASEPELTAAYRRAAVRARTAANKAAVTAADYPFTPSLAVEAFTCAADAVMFAAADRGAAFLGESRRQCHLWRDIFGNPFRPVTVDPRWLTTDVVQLARQMYESRDFTPMPILADALQDAGCETADVLDHCRGAGPHVRGCWVVDLVLGKS